jgi:4-hydroxybenzoate polyprenyltransferase
MVIGFISNILKTSRPKQLVKNILVIIPILLSINLWLSQTSEIKFELLLYSLTGIFSFATSSWMIYIINDFLDIKIDRAHPIKSKRAIASGAVSFRVSVILICTLALLSIISSYFLGIHFLTSVILYQILMISYCIYLKRIFLLDIFIVSIGYTLRVFGGAMLLRGIGLITAQINISIWLYLCTALGSFFVLLIKRSSEISNNVIIKRKSIEKYNQSILNKIIIFTEISTYGCYALYCISSPFGFIFKGNTPENYSLIITLPLVIIGMRRYKITSSLNKLGEHPEEVILKDKILQVTFISWVILSAALISTIT